MREALENHIAHVHHRYRMLGAPSTASETASRLDCLVQERVPSYLSDALDQALGDDPTVYVLRQVRSAFTLNLAENATDDELARQWARCLVRAMMRHIDQAERREAGLVRFADQAEYVAQFASDLVRGRAWQLWFYATFARLKGMPVSEALTVLLTEHREHLPAVLCYLYQDSALEDLLAKLDQPTLRALWFHDLGVEQPASQASLRPLFAAALRLIDRIEAWKRRPPPAETLFHTYLATRPAPVDWRDRDGLAAGVSAVLQFLGSQGYLEQLDDRKDEISEEALARRLDQALQDLDWLEAKDLRSYVLRLLSRSMRRGDSLRVGALGDGPRPEVRAESSHRRPRTDPSSQDVDAELQSRPLNRGPTPRQRELLSDLLAALPRILHRLDRRWPDSPANALRLYAVLVDRAPRWAGDALATSVIQRALVAWKWLDHSAAPAQAIRRLRQQDLEAALGTLPEAARESAAGALRFLAVVGKPGLSLVETLIGVAGTAAARAPAVGAERLPAVLAQVGMETECAGVFLLLRAILDARLPWLVESAGLSPLSALLASLAVRWAGSAAWGEGTLEFSDVEGQLDPGLSLLAGVEEPLSLEAMHDHWASIGPACHDRLQAALLSVLAGQRLLRVCTMHVHRLPLAEGWSALVAGDETGRLWPLVRAVGSGDDVDRAAIAAVTTWMPVWQTATGHQPAVIAAGSLAAALRDVPGVVALPEPAPMTDEDLDEEGDGAVHRRSGHALLAAWDALAFGQVGVYDADLTVALTAIALLRLWARWLRQFAQSSAPYLLTHLIRRPGRLFVREDRITVRLAPRPLDIALEMAGYMAPLDRVPWLGGRSIQFEFGE